MQPNKVSMDAQFEDPQVQATDRPLLPGSHATPTPPKCNTRAIVALINNLGIVYHQYCSSSYLDYIDEAVPPSALGNGNQARAWYIKNREGRRCHRCCLRTLPSLGKHRFPPARRCQRVRADRHCCDPLQPLPGPKKISLPHKSQKWIYKIKTLLIDKFSVSNLAFNVTQIHLVDLAVTLKS